MTGTASSSCARATPGPLLSGPGAVVRAINKALLDRPPSHGTGVVTLVYGHLTPGRDGGVGITLVRAGHNLPLHLDARSVARPVAGEGSLLGIGPSPRLRTHRLRLLPAESLLLYTDGITEARDHEGEQFGEERLTRALTTAAPPATAGEVIDAVTEAVHKFTGPGK